MIAEIWNSILCFTAVLKPLLQSEVTNHCLYTVQIALNFPASSFCCKITLIWLGSPLNESDMLLCRKKDIADQPNDTVQQIHEQANVSFTISNMSDTQCFYDNHILQSDQGRPFS